MDTRLNDAMEITLNNIAVGQKVKEPASDQMQSDLAMGFVEYGHNPRPSELVTAAQAKLGSRSGLCFLGGSFASMAKGHTTLQQRLLHDAVLQMTPQATSDQVRRKDPPMGSPTLKMARPVNISSLLVKQQMKSVEDAVMNQDAQQVW